nr:sarcosine oxidase subunit gamma family protein [Phenylobacterium aquaticum]
MAETSARFAAAFGAALPGAGQAITTSGLRVIWREPGAWMIRVETDPAQTILDRLVEIAGADGAVTDISGAAARCVLVGTDWRVLLTHGGVFDAENPAFAPGCVAGTVIEHMAVRFDVIAETRVDAYVAPSYAADLFAYWTSVAGNLDVRG